MRVQSDFTPPTLNEFTLDLDSNTLILTFSEVIETTSFRLQFFTLQSSSTSSAVSQTLTNSVVASTIDSNIITIDILSMDLYPLQQNTNLGTSIENTFISIGRSGLMGGAQDKGSPANTLTEILPTAALQASSVIEDETSPLLESFSLTLSDGRLLLTFSEVVNISSFDLEKFIFQNGAFSANESASLSNGSPIQTANNAAIVEIALISDDFDKIQSNINLGTEIDNSFLNLTLGAVYDMSGNPNAAAHTAAQANSITPDTSQPMLLSFEIDVNRGAIIFSYSEAINVDAFALTNIVLYNTSSLLGMSFPLTAASRITSPSGSTIVVDINGDINPLRETMTFGGSTNSFLTILSGTAVDFAGNAADGILMPMVPAVFTADDMGPLLTSFELDLNDGVLTLNFDETIVQSTFTTSQLMLQNAPRDAIEFVAITSTSFRRVNFATVIITLNSRDIDELNLRPELATGIDNTFISLSNLTVEDILGNAAREVSLEDAQQVTVYVRDGIRPNASAFQIDLNNLTATIMFDEVTDPLSVNMTFLTVQNSPTAPTQSFTFSGLESARSIGRAVVIDLTQEDVNGLNALDICTTMADCFAVVNSGFITDAAGNDVFTSEPLPASTFMRDIQPPAFERFVLMDIDSGIMILEFTETIDAESVQLNMLRLQRDSSGGPMLTLSGGEIVSGSSSQLEIRFLQSDLDAIKRNIDLTNLCTRNADCYVRFPSTFATDAFGNALPAVANDITPNSNEYPSLYIRDTTGPLIVAFNLDLENSLLDLSFNEVYRSFEPTEITLQDGPIATTSYTLTGGSILSSNNSGLTIQLEEIDARRIKGDPSLATSAMNTFLINTANLVVAVSYTHLTLPTIYSV